MRFEKSVIKKSITEISVERFNCILDSESGEGSGTPLSTLAWKIPWVEEPGRLQSMGSLRVGQD